MSNRRCPSTTATRADGQQKPVLESHGTLLARHHPFLFFLPLKHPPRLYGGFPNNTHWLVDLFSASGLVQVTRDAKEGCDSCLPDSGPLWIYNFLPFWAGSSLDRSHRRTERCKRRGVVSWQIFERLRNTLSNIRAQKEPWKWCYESCTLPSFHKHSVSSS